MMPEIKNLDDILKIPLQHQKDGSIYNMLDARKKELFNIFYDKTKSVDERNSVFDEANKIAKYLGEKEIKWRATKPKGAVSRVITEEDRRKNCDNFIKYLANLNIKFSDLEDSHKAVILSNVWGGTS